MGNKLFQDTVELWGEETQLNMIVEKSMLLGLSIQKFKRIDRKEDYIEYSSAYNQVCENIADMKLMLEQAEFLFNADYINQHYLNKIENLQIEMNGF